MNFQQYSSFHQIVIILIIINVAISLMSFGNIRMFEKLKFRIGDILEGKQYYRIFSAAFVHGGYVHLFFNMYVLYIFGNVMEYFISIPEFLAIYFISLIIGNLVPLYINRNQYNYSAVGASGAVSGILYASIYFVPTEISINFVPAWIFGILYLAYSIYASKKNNDNIGHDAHIGGAISGLVIVYMLKPEYLMKNWVYLIGLLLPISYYVFTFLKSNKISLKANKERKPNYSNRSIDDLYNFNRTKKIRELNEILEKVDKYGLDSLSKAESVRLDELSKELS